MILLQTNKQIHQAAEKVQTEVHRMINDDEILQFVLVQQNIDTLFFFEPVRS